ncbi:hypothetical protein Ccrd_009664 [Cynara cardunculus var. scolymus]|uniref:Maternal effect embryo arrest 59 n=1 Tax=Cynara cardunculus var. scolymus TaxID=59895 RepID=A0A118K795_CYNCS|nr:hypothetical protein Ccrd_009664 [Cynara cardunculus var. scolymus]
METSNRPSRSDAHLSKEEEAKIEGETRDYFDGLAPRRHTKPQRSEYAAQYIDALPSDGVSHEYAEFQQLEQNSQKLVYAGNETGTGFINVDNTKGSAFNLSPESESAHHASCKGNPATNEWTPAPADTASSVSNKPHRSEN